MKIILSILFLFITSLCFAQTDTTYIKGGEFFITNLFHKNKLKIEISKWQYIEPIKIKGNLYMIPNSVYLQNKELVESKINLNRVVIRRVKKSELIEPKL